MFYSFLSGPQDSVMLLRLCTLMIRVCPPSPIAVGIPQAQPRPKAYPGFQQVKAGKSPLTMKRCCRCLLATTAKLHHSVHRFFIIVRSSYAGNSFSHACYTTSLFCQVSFLSASRGVVTGGRIFQLILSLKSCLLYFLIWRRIVFTRQEIQVSLFIRICFNLNVSSPSIELIVIYGDMTQ